MPQKPLKQCFKPGCGNLCKGAYCDEHKTKPEDKQRPNANQRGYDYSWQRYSRAFLRRNPLCVECLARGDLIPAQVVDHIVDHKGNAVLFRNSENHQALCKRCHDIKTATTNAKSRRDSLKNGNIRI